jgi:hypothetical protein
MLAAKQVHFLNTVFAMLCLLALMTYFAIANQLYGRDWSDLLAYIIALRFTVSALRSVSTVFVLFSRFLPEYSSYAMAVEGADRIAKRREHIGQSSISLPCALTLKLGSHARLPSQKRLSIDTSKALFVLVPWRTVRTELDAIASRLEHRLVESVDFARRAIVKASANGRMEDEVRESGVPTIIPMELWRARLAPSDSFFVVVGHRAEAAMGNEQIGSVVVMDDRRIIGGGDRDWLRQNLEPIKAALAAAAAVRETADDDEEDLEDDFE